MSVRQLLASMDSCEITEWIAYDQLEPFGEQREDLRVGQICSTVANHSFSPPTKPRKPTDYMLFAQADQPETQPTLLKDAKAQSDLIRQVIFGVKKD